MNGPRLLAILGYVAILTTSGTALAAPTEMQAETADARQIQFGDQAVHDFHGIIRLADLVIRPRHLVEHLVVTLVVRIRLEDFLVSLDRLTRPGRDGFRAFVE